jgi:Flp pilus assembly protein TadD
VLLGLVGLGVVWKLWPSDGAKGPASDNDPRLTFATPYRNVRPEVKYVGDKVCAKCHDKECDSYRHHPMGRALAPAADASPIENYKPAAFDPFVAPDPFIPTGLHYSVRRQDRRVVHRQWAADEGGKVLAEREAAVHFAVGSGSRGRTYLVNQDGYLFESPITWYPQPRRWDLSPGYDSRNQHFGRPITAGCLFCHSNYADHVPDTVNHYRQKVFRGFAIGCERCHGPGELHVQRRTSGQVVAGLDDTIVNPARLEHSLREGVCQQCHLLGEQRVLARGRAYFDYRPGLPLHLFMMDFVMDRESDRDFKFVGSVEQMYASRCFQASREPKKLGCISCHDPHALPSAREKAAFYRKRCLQCHTEKSCNLPLEARLAKNKDSCIACHMPRTDSEINHTSITDHRVPRRPPKSAETGPPPRSFPGSSALVPFHRNLVDLSDEAVSRNRGVALIQMLQKGPPQAVARQLAERALPLLETALTTAPHDLPAWEAKGDALYSLGRPEEALAAYATALAQKPDLETTLHAAAKLALEMDRPDTARTYLERLIRVNPWFWQYHHLLAAISYQKGEWQRAVRELRQSLKLEPFNSTTRRRLLIECYLRLGKKDKAQAEFETMLQLNTEDRRQDLRRWYEAQQR